MRALVVFHSRSGKTRRVGQLLADRLFADLEEIVPMQPHALSLLGSAACGLEAMAGTAPALVPPVKDPSAYQLVIVGTPVWCWGVSGPVRSWLQQHRASLAHVRLAFFSTMGGSGSARAFATMGALAGHRPCATLALGGAQMRLGGMRALRTAVGVFLRDLRSGSAPRFAPVAEEPRIRRRA